MLRISVVTKKSSNQIKSQLPTLLTQNFHMIDILCHFSKNVLRTQTQSFKSSQLNSTTTKKNKHPTNNQKNSLHILLIQPKRHSIYSILCEKRDENREQEEESLEMFSLQIYIRNSCINYLVPFTK